MILVVLAAQAAVSTPPPPPPPGPPPPPPPIVQYLPAGGPTPTPALTRWEPLFLRCDGEAVTAVRPPRAGVRSGYVGIQTQLRTVSFTFTIDADGRPLDITRERPEGYGGGDDLGPALAAARFAPGAPRTGCRVSFNAVQTPVAEAPPELVMEYSVFPDRPPTKPIIDRLRPAGSTCYEPSPGVLLRRFPDFDKLPKLPGTTGWSMVAFDIDANGQPVGVRTVAAAGSPALDAAAREAVAGSRFAEGAPRRGCLYPYWQRGTEIAPPSPPEEADFRPAKATCTSKADWATPPTLTYPQNYRRRGIEGWAVVTYDVAPWGEVGNAKVAAAQPAAEFGDQALRVLRSAKRQASTSGYTGCVDRVLFRLAKPGEEATAVGDPAPPF